MIKQEYKPAWAEKQIIAFHLKALRLMVSVTSTRFAAKWTIAVFFSSSN